MNVDELLTDGETHIILVCGSGGVGKTTLSAALALRAAETGRRVVVLTIDPARRLATAMGLDLLSNTPSPVEIDQSAGGSLEAMMLDMKRTFDDSIAAHASPERTAQLLANPFYQVLSTSFAGTQEYMAMEKLGQLYREGVPSRWDLIIVDTPPSVSALDFLDAPERMGRLLDGKALSLLMAPARAGLRFGLSIVNSALSTVLGRRALTDLETFVTAFESLLGGFRARADQTRATLSSRHTKCVVVASPAAPALRQARALARRLDQDAIALAGIVVNRVTPRFVSSTAEPISDVERWAANHLAATRSQRAAEDERIRALGSHVTLMEDIGAEVISLAALREYARRLAS